MMMYVSVESIQHSINQAGYYSCAIYRYIPDLLASCALEGRLVYLDNEATSSYVFSARAADGT